ncbi:hypothetical protein QBK99_17530 [Corticibacterium sp. UT-5YL-CI-8]|nr:hypothetical protein [Tianweitania sp. UT-5YL-CI-8]
MFRTTDIVLIAVMVSAAAFTYKTKHEAENRLDTIRKIQAQIRYEEDTIDLLNADWSLLTQPARLQKLTETFQEDLKLQVTQPQQIVGFGDIPEKPVELPEGSDEKVVSNGHQTKDKVVTGSIAR